MNERNGARIGRFGGSIPPACFEVQRPTRAKVPISPYPLTEEPNTSGKPVVRRTSSATGENLCDPERANTADGFTPD